MLAYTSIKALLRHTWVVYNVAVSNRELGLPLVVDRKVILEGHDG
jgi:hypothetical protein